jgi:hypothetical protein
LGISLACIDHAATLVPPSELTPIIHFSEWTTFKAWDSIRTRLKGVGVNSFFMYPNDFKEHDADAKELKAYVGAVESSAKSGFGCFALHGGYFAIVLEKRGLVGFGNGVGYGEWRDSGYHRGGSAEIRLYMPKLHRFINPAEAQILIEKDAAYFTADSELLTEYAAANKPLTAIQPAEALDHFMDSRDQEIQFVRQNSEDVITAELRETIKRLNKIGQLEAERYGISLSRWTDALISATLPAKI